MKALGIPAALEKPGIPEELLAACRLSPALYVEDVLGVALHSFQPEFLDAVRDTDEVAVRSANGVGKSIAAALLANWFLDCCTVGGECKVLVTAPTHRQCEDTYRYFKAFRKNARYALPGNLMEQPFCRITEMWFARFFTAKDKEAFAGPHANAMLVIVEEAGGVAEDIYEGVYGCASGERDRIVHIGNPWSPAGTFASLFKRGSARRHGGRLRVFTVSALESPNVKLGREVVPGLVSRRAIDRIEARFGKGSDVYRVRVLGLPPRQDSASVVPLSAWEAARVRGDRFPAQEHPVVGRLRAGLDLGGAGDACALVTRDDVRVREMRTWSGEKLSVSREIARAWLLQNAAGVLAVDAGGLGQGTAEELEAEFGGRVVSVQFGGAQVSEDAEAFLSQTGRAEQVPLYANRRAELWHQLSRWLEVTGEVPAMLDAELLQELEEDVLCPRWKRHQHGRLLMEPKEETKKRLGRSPNLGDALALAVAADFEEFVACAGAPTVAAAPDRWAPTRGREAPRTTWREYAR